MLLSRFVTAYLIDILLFVSSLLDECSHSKVHLQMKVTTASDKD